MSDINFTEQLLIDNNNNININSTDDIEYGIINIDNSNNCNNCIICLMPSNNEYDVVDMNSVILKYAIKPCKCTAFVHEDCLRSWYKSKPKCLICHKRLKRTKEHEQLIRRSSSSSGIIETQQNRIRFNACLNDRQGVCFCNLVIFVFFILLFIFFKDQY